ncbi:MAG TPA: MFS transporter [Longimicrobiales bacterium]|nr:MFS transporter [Longimicrobiales bacterium]
MATSTTTRPSSSRDADAHRWTILALLSVAELLGMSLWFTAGATAPALSARWQLDAGASAMLTTVVQLGFVLGTATAALLNLADVLPARRYLAVSAVLAALANAALLVAPGYGAALVTRAFTGFFLAGVYPPAMKMAATWFRSARGLAIGTVVGALTIGKAMPYLSSALPGMDWQWVVATSSIGALVAAALIALAYRDGPYAFPQRRFSLHLVGTVLRDRPTRLAIGGYLGHMWELYAMWSLVAVYFFDVFTAQGVTAAASVARAGIVAFVVIAAGGLGSVLAGSFADRMGRERVTIWSMAMSGTCSLLVGWMIDAPLAVIVAVAIVWGFAIVADSAQFSALVTEVAPAHAVGTALTLQTSLGFLLTAFSIWIAMEVASRFGWGIAFSMLAAGPALGILAMARLRTLRASRN